MHRVFSTRQVRVEFDQRKRPFVLSDKDFTGKVRRFVWELAIKHAANRL